MYIGITKAIQEKYRIEPQVVDLEILSILCWHAQKFVFQRKTGLLIMNNRTRYCVFLYDIKKKEMENLLPIFKEQLKRNMMSNKIEEDKIEKYLNELVEIKFIKTSERSLLGQLKDSLFCIEHSLYSTGKVIEMDIDDVNDWLNGMPMAALAKLGYVPFPDRAMTEEINKLY